MRKRFHLAAALLLTAALPGAAGAQEEDDQRGTRFFALHMSRDARALADTVDEHLRAERWSEAIGGLQTLIEKHGGDVLPASRRESADEYSQFDAYPGAAEWAHARFRELPTEALVLYAARYEDAAGRALEKARRRGDRRGLVAITETWPIAPATARAWWTLGDLELEEGHLEAARAAWLRGAGLGRLLGREETAGAQRRRGLYEALKAAERGPDLNRGTRVRGAREEIPRKDAEPWLCDLDLEPFDRKSGTAYHQNLVPTLAGERLFVASTLRLFAVDAFTGDLAWQAGPPAGWGRLDLKRKAPLFSGIADDQLLVQAGVGGGIAVAALQIPFSENDNYDWQGIPILTAIPERRLYAFDADSGDMLWSHAPHLTWDGSRWTWDRTFSGYPEYMMVASSPTVAGARVLVPCYRMQGRIDYHIACYELQTGELLWSTPVVSGQRPRNMFGRANREFAASPLVVHGDRVIAQTDLGTVAALDLMTGRILWQSLYRQIELPKTKSYQPPERILTWRIAPPVVVDDLVVSTASDSHDIVAYRLSDGRALWAYDAKQLMRIHRDTKDLEYNLLLGADRDAIYLAGEKVSALEKPGGLASRTPFVSKWTHELAGKEPTRRAPRPSLTRNAVVVPTRKERIVLDRENGRRLATHSGDWPTPDHGNVLAEDGVLYVLSNERLLGFFDWDALLERQRLKLAKTPNDPEAALATAELYARRGRSFLEEGDLGGALDSLREARGLLEPLNKDLEAGDGEARLVRRVDEELHDALRLEAEVLARRGNRTAALRTLERALPLASTPEELRDALLQKDRLLLLSQRPEDRLAVLSEIEERCGDLLLPSDPLRRSPPLWLVGDASIDPARLSDWQEAPIPMRLWALLNRAQIHLAERDTTACLEELHRALAAFGDLEISEGVDVGTLVRERISMRCLAPDGARAYAPFERRASELLDRAIGADDARLLEEVGRLYPHSRASQEALHARLDQAFLRDDPASVAAIVSSSLATPGGDRTVEASMLLRLARSLGRAGNVELERALIERLADEFPRLTSDLPEHDGAPLTSLVKRLDPLPPTTRLPSVPSFDHTVLSSGKKADGAYQYLGHLARAGAELHVYLVNNRLEAFAADTPGQRAWKYYLPEVVSGAEACAITADRIFVGDQVMVRALDPNGTPIWERELRLSVQQLVVHDGIVVANLRDGNVVAFDAVAGTPLWELSLGKSGYWTGPIAGDHRLVFFSQMHARPERALVVDLFRGRVLLELDLGKVDGKLARTAWIDDGKLIVPHFGRYSRPEVVGYDLDTGEDTWTVRFDDGESFHSIVAHDGEDYLITTVAELGQNTQAAVYRLDTEFGTTRAVQRLDVGEEPMGILREDRFELPAPYLFTYATEPTQRGIPVRAIHLPFAAVWTFTLPLGPKESHGAMPLPAVSEDCVAIAYATRNRTGLGRRKTTLVFLDKRAGKRLDTLDLHEDFNHATLLELRGLGEALFVIGKGRKALGLRMETLEKLR